MFDLRRYLRQHRTVTGTHNDDTEWSIVCDCEVSRGKREGKLWINVEKGQGFCFRCRKRLGDIIDIVRYVEGLSLSEAVRRVRDSTGSAERLRGVVQRLTETKAMAKTAKPERIDVPIEFIPAWRAERLPGYFRARGITRKLCDRYSIGFCESGFFQNRMIIPVFDLEGELATFVARYMGKTSKGVKKVLYPKGSRASCVVFNLNAARKRRTIVITEGVFDAIRVGVGGVALLGKHASTAQIRQLVRVGADRRLVVLLDEDAADDAEDLAVELAEACADVRIGRLPLGRGDPGECTQAELRRTIGRARILGARYDRVRRALGDL